MKSVIDTETHTFFEEMLQSQKVFERGIDIGKKKQNGVFLTSKLDTIESILSIIDYSKIENKKILEPACGQGIFILRIINKLYKINPSREAIDNLISKSIIFNDVDASMVEKTIKNVKALYHHLFGAEYRGNFQAYVSDFTLRNNDKAKTLFYDNSNEIILSEFYGKIDYIIGNPPYISLYGRRDKKENEQQRVDYLQNYNQFPSYVQNGKINLVMLFIEHSLDFLKPMGNMSFIIDLAFFETAYQYTRQFLLQNTCIEKIIANIKDFEVASGQIILQVAKNKNNKDNIVKIQDEKTLSTFFVKQSQWENPKDEYKFRYNNCDSSQKIIDTIHSKKDKKIIDVYPNKNLRTCTMLLDMEERFTLPIEDLKKVDENLLPFPYYQGSKSLTEKYGKFKYGKYFFYDKSLQDNINDELKTELEKQGVKNKKRIGLGETVIYSNPKVFIRQSAKELIASLDFAKSAANNSLYVFSLRDDSEKSLFTLKFLCGWLNSDLMTFYAQQRGIIRYAQGKQPQIKISDLGSIPFPLNLQFQEKIVILVEKILKEDVKRELLKEKISNLVYEYYNLNQVQITHIGERIRDF